MRLEASHLSVRYGAVDALRDVSVTIESGSITTVIGANGAGKSTLLNTFAGLVPATSGQILLDGCDISRMPAEQRVGLGLTLSPEGRRLFPDMTVHENLAIGAYARGRAGRQNAARDLDRIYALFEGLGRRRSSLARMLSGGEQQMCAIGRALMAEPKVLLLDEPTLGLAPVVVNDLARIIRNIHASGVTIALVEQNSRLALSLADTGYVFETGRVVLSGSAQSLLADPAVHEAYLGG
jgi:branched-chain amino acid transport system ATP-binding protein